MLTNDTSFWPCSVSLYLSLPRKLIGLLDPSSPVRLIAATWPHGVCLIVGDEGDGTVSGFVLRPLGGPGSPYLGVVIK
jgi:hypothetical protein